MAIRGVNGFLGLIDWLKEKGILLPDLIGGSGASPWGFSANLSRSGETFIGTPFKDNINGTEDDDFIDGLGGNDKLGGEQGDDEIHGGDGDDNIDGGDGSDDLKGDAGEDQINGNDGMDLLEGGEDDDDLNGGDGFDTAVFSGSALDYTWTFSQQGGGRWTVVDDEPNVDGNDGIDTLKSVEALQFNDVTVFIDGTNNVPFVFGENFTIAEDGVAAGDLSDNDFEFDGDPLTYTLDTGPSNGTAVVGINGNFTYTPNADFNGTDSFTYLVDDGNGGTATATVDITIDPVVDIADDAATTDEDNAVNTDVLANDSFEDPAAAVTAVTQGANGSVAIQGDGTVTYTPNADYNGADSYTYTVTSGGVTETATVNVTVNAVVDIADDAATTDEDNAVNTDVLANDTFEGTPVVTGVTQGANGSVAIQGDGTVTYTPNADFNGTDSYTYTVTSGGVTETATVDVTVNAVVDIADDAATTDEDNAVNTDVLANDTFEGTPVVTGVTQGANGSVAIQGDGTVTYTPNADYNGADSYTYTVTSGGVTETATVNVTVNAVVDIADDAATTDEDNAVNTDVLANDTFEGTPVVTGVTQGANGSVAIQGDGTVTYTPNADFNGTDSYTYTVTSGGVTETATVNVTVTQVNDPATFGGDTSGSGDEDGAPVTGTLTVADAADGMTNPNFTVTGAASNGVATIDPVSGAWSYDSDPDYNGPDSFTVSVTDDDGNVESQVISIDVNPINDNPVAVEDAAMANSEQLINIDVLANDFDVDGDTLTVTGAVADNGTATVLGDGTIDYTSNAGFGGEDQITYTISDGNGGTATGTVVVTVNAPGNDAPTAGALSATVSEDGPIIPLTADVNDPDGDPLTIVADDTRTVGTITDDGNGNFTYDPTGVWDLLEEGEIGIDLFTYTVTDPFGASATATATITITGVNDAPLAAPDSATALEDMALVVSAANGLLSNDTDVENDPLTVDSYTQPTNGTVVVNADGSYTYTPNLDYNGPDSFTYFATDGLDLSAETTVTINVVPTNDPPVANDDTVTTLEDVAVVINPLANDTDDLQPIPADFNVLTQPSNGTLTVDPGTGELFYAPNPNFNGTDSFTYEAVDNVGATSGVATVTINVTPVEDIPVIDGQPGNPDSTDFLPLVVNEVDGSGPVTIALGDVVTEGDGDPLSFSVPSVNVGGNIVPFQIVSDGAGVEQLTFDPGAFGLATGEDATVTVSFTASDGKGGTASSSFQLTVNGDGDAGTPGDTNTAPVAPDHSVSGEDVIVFDFDSIISDADGDMMDVTDLQIISGGSGRSNLTFVETTTNPNEYTFTGTGIPGGNSVTFEIEYTITDNTLSANNTDTGILTVTIDNFVF